MRRILVIIALLLPGIACAGVPLPWGVPAVCSAPMAVVQAQAFANSRLRHYARQEKKSRVLFVKAVLPLGHGKAVAIGKDRYSITCLIEIKLSDGENLVGKITYSDDIDGGVDVRLSRYP